jgi:CheY-like chemotaxis protein
VKALVFDDDPSVCSFMCTVLRHRGCEVISFPGPVFCPLIEDEVCPHPSGKPCADVILTDVRMPEINGLDFVVRQLKKGCKCKHMALISGNRSDAELTRARQLPVKIFTKPVRITEINAWLDEVEKG